MRNRNVNRDRQVASGHRAPLPLDRAPLLGEPTLGHVPRPASPRVHTLHTLGPHGTNCESAAHRWLADHRGGGTVHLYDRLETAWASTPRSTGYAVLACIAYPDLHELVFDNHPAFELLEVATYPTDEMVLARRAGTIFRRLSTHPAPRPLVTWPDHLVDLASSNAQAALDCAAGLADACITTLTAARTANLDVLRSFGAVRMGFSIHVPRGEGP